MVKKIINFIAGIYIFFVMYVCSFGLHIYTSWVIAESYGTFLGLVGFFCPIISEIIMIILYSLFYGILNVFNILILIYIILVLSVYGVSSLTEKFE